MDTYSHRAMLNYGRDNPDGPDPVTATVTRHDDRGYVVLRGPGRVLLAVYRIRSDQKLRKMRRWPDAVAQAGARPQPGTDQ